jgi:hypothetical protein
MMYAVVRRETSLFFGKGISWREGGADHGGGEKEGKGEDPRVVTHL